MAKMKSPNYPAIGLSEAIDSVRVLWEAEKRTPVDSKTAVLAMGYKALSGPASARLSALKKYGLIEADGKGVRVSQLAMRILHNQDDSEDRQKAIQEAAQKPDLFRELAVTHSQASDNALRSYLLVQKGFSEAGAKQFILAFHETLSLAKALGSEYDSDKQDQGGSPMNDAGMAPQDQGRQGKPSGTRVFSWPLPNDTIAELRLTGGPITQEHFEMLRQYLELAKAAVPKTVE